MSNIVDLNLAELKKAIIDKGLSAKEVTEAYLQAMERGVHLNCFISTTADKAIQMQKLQIKELKVGTRCHWMEFQ